MPDKPIRVICFKPADRSVFYTQWTDPDTGKKRTKSTGHKIQRKAESFRKQLEDELNDGTFRGRRTTWDEFRKRVERDFLPGKRANTRDRYKAAMNAV